MSIFALLIKKNYNFCYLINESYKTMNSLEEKRAKLQENTLNQVLHGTNWLFHLPENVKHENLFYLLINNTKMYPDYLFKNNDTYPEMKNILSLFEHKGNMFLACWFDSTNSFLNGKRPRDVIKYDISLVLRAANYSVTENYFS